MKRMACAVAIGTLLATGLSAQTPPRRIKSESSSSRFSLDTPIVQLLADPRAKAAFARHMPTVVGNPNLKQFERMSLRELAAHPHARLAPAKIKALEADLLKIK